MGQVIYTTVYDPSVKWKRKDRWLSHPTYFVDIIWERFTNGWDIKSMAYDNQAMNPMYNFTLAHARQTHVGMIIQMTWVFIDMEGMEPR